MSKQKLKSLKIGFIPTMGALHKGHISLITNSKSQNLLTVCSIFVNPTQFNDPSDFAKYPQTIESDILALEKAGTDLLFLPNQAQIYPLGTENQPNYDLGNLENLLEGKYRPGHFQGVCQVVDRLLELVQPDKLFLGQKDFQQCMVIQKLLALKQSQTELIICPTLREASGLAMSSRNMRLSIEGRQKAAMIYQVLRNIQTNLLSNATIEELLEEGKSSLLVAGFDSIDYLELVAVQSLEDIPNWEPNIQAVLIIAVYLEGVRLIDNLPI
ncbi:MAG: pantoate--beta-alanine ligase [Sphingobacteriia bacterium 35-40-5]|nr:MAG: pantoate--beta-alanine ligase [Sphingobacteriia bacterium 35-40-5]